MENAQYFYNQLKADSDFAVVTEPEISSVVFRYKGNDDSISGEALDEINKKVRRTLIHKYGTIIGQTISDGRVCLKFTLLNPRITHKKLDELKTLIKTLSSSQE
jgi:L-2,4-diaminobutyrate decarboxylase